MVGNKFCPNCAQENSDTRKTFHHLFLHFFEDLTHYENAFWRTIKILLLNPALLTKEYLSGKDCPIYHWQGFLFSLVLLPFFNGNFTKRKR